MSKAKNMTGYPSIDKPWLKYYDKKDIIAEIPHETVISYAFRLNKERLDNPAIDSLEGNYTYRETFDLVRKTAAALQAFHFGKGDIALIMLPAMSYEVFLFYAIDLTGGVMSFLPPDATIDSICKTIRQFSSDYLFILDSFLSEEMEQTIYEFTNVKNIITIGASETFHRNTKTLSWAKFIESGNGIQVAEATRNPADLLFIAKTGGSTGEPKSVMLSDNGFNILVHQYLHTELPYDSGDRWLRLWPIFSATAAVSSLHLAICAGMESVIRNFPVNISEFDKMVLYEKPNHLILIPQLLDVLEKSALLHGQDLSFIKSAGCGGLSITNGFEERVNQFFERYHLPLFLGYGWGCTENSSSAAMRMNKETTKIGYVGIPLVDTTVSVFDPDSGKELSYNEEGELCILSQTTMLGYYNEPEMTHSVLKKHHDGNTWIHTGDLGIVNEDGFVQIHGRMTRTIFVFPTAKIYPAAIENVISTVQGILETAVIGIPDAEHEGFEKPICYIVSDKNYESDNIINNVTQLCETTYMKYERPQKIIPIDAFPLTKVGKIDYRALEELARHDL